MTVGKAPTTASVDITDGDNLYYKAAKGWGYPTGPGTPNNEDPRRGSSLQSNFFFELIRSDWP